MTLVVATESVPESVAESTLAVSVRVKLAVFSVTEPRVRFAPVTPTLQLLASLKLPCKLSVPDPNASVALRLPVMLPVLSANVADSELSETPPKLALARVPVSVQVLALV